MTIITYKKLYNITLFYLGRYEASTTKVKNMLNRRIYKTSLTGTPIPPESGQWIDDIIQKMQDLGYINNNRFCENKIRQLSNMGKSISFITQKLKQDGIDSETIQQYLDQYNDINDVDRAKIWLKKKKKGPFRENNSPEFYQKDLAALARNGFSYETAVNALKDN